MPSVSFFKITFLIHFPENSLCNAPSVLYKLFFVTFLHANNQFNVLFFSYYLDCWCTSISLMLCLSFFSYLIAYLSSSGLSTEWCLLFHTNTAVFDSFSSGDTHAFSINASGLVAVCVRFVGNHFIINKIGLLFLL